MGRRKPSYPQDTNASTSGRPITPLELTGNGDGIPDLFELWKNTWESETGLSDLTIVNAPPRRKAKTFWNQSYRLGNPYYLYDNTANPERLRIQDEMAFFATVRPILLGAGAAKFIAVCGAGAPDTEVNNSQWGLFVDANGYLVYTHENGAGTNVQFSSDYPIFGLSEVAEEVDVGFIRGGLSEYPECPITIMAGGRSVGEGLLTLPPTGGGNSRLTVGQSNTSTPGDWFNGEIGALGLFDQKITKDIYLKTVRKVIPCAISY